MIRETVSAPFDYNAYNVGKINNHFNTIILLLLLPQHFIATKFMEFVTNLPEENGTRSVCGKLCSLYALRSLQQHEGDLYQGTKSLCIHT